MAKRLMLIDGNSLLLRAFFASSHSGETMPQLPNGQYVNGVNIFLRMMFNILEHYKPSHAAVGWDLGRSTTWRWKKYPEYKAHRQEKPVEFNGQQELTMQILDRIGIFSFGMEEYEADDVLGTLATKFEAAGDVLTYLVTSDGDYMQLLSDRTCVLRPVKGGVSSQTKPKFIAETGFDPSQVPDLKALMGDVSDNLPGVSGIGEKTAKALIQKFGSVEALYERLTDLEEDKALRRYRAKLEAGREEAILCKELATIVRDIPDVLAVPLDGLYLQLRKEPIRKVFTELELTSLAQRFAG